MGGVFGMQVCTIWNAVYLPALVTLLVSLPLSLTSSSFNLCIPGSTFALCPSKIEFYSHIPVSLLEATTSPPWHHPRPPVTPRAAIT